MKIYRVYNGTVHELEVRETKKMFVAVEKSTRAFRYSSKFYKEECSTSPLQAIERRTLSILAQKEILKRQLDGINSELVALQELKEKHRYKQKCSCGCYDKTEDTQICANCGK